MRSRLAHLWKPEVNFACARIGPTASDDLGSGVKLDAVGTVHMQVAEERSLPAAEAVIRDRDRNWYVDSHHPNFNVELELSCCSSVAREDRCPVAVGIGIDKIESGIVGRDAHYGKNGSEDFVFVTAHSGFDVVDE